MNSSSQGSLKETDPKAYLEQIIQAFFTDPLPDACEALMYRLDLALQNNSELSAFERYAARLLKQAHADKLRPIAARHHIEVGRLSATNLAWFRFDESELEPQEVEMLLAIESIINRLIMMVMNAPSPEIYTYLVSNTGEGSAFEQDWALLRNSALEASRLVNGFEEKNPLLTIRETTASVGGEWDMRTRIAFAMENLVLPFRLSYRFDCDSNAGAVLIDFVAPTYVLFPDLIWNTTIKNWDDVSALHGFDQSALTVRTMALLAALGFGSSVGVTKVIVTALADNVEGAVLCSAEFSRMAYLNGFLPSLTSGAFTAVENTAKLNSLEKMLSATYLSIKVGPDGALEEVERIEAGFPNRGGELYNDTRSLPASIQSFLHAQVVSDLDIYHVEDEKLAEVVHQASEEAKEYPMASQLTLEQVIADFDEAKESNRRYLYCSDPISRSLMGLIDQTDEKYLKYPDAIFAAHSNLSDIYQEQGQSELALAQSQCMIAAAPTSSVGYFDAIISEMKEDQFDAVVDQVKTFLNVAHERRAIHYAYYRLAFALLLKHDFETSVAAYTLVINDGGDFADAAKSEVVEPLEALRKTELPTPEEAAECLYNAGIPLAPTQEVRKTLAWLAITLTDANLFNAAAPLTLGVAANTYQDVLMSVVTSLTYGEKHAA